MSDQMDRVRFHLIGRRSSRHIAAQETPACQISTWLPSSTTRPGGRR